MAERSDAPLANDSGAGAPPNDDPDALTGGGAPSGLPEDVEEHDPLGPEESNPEGEGDTSRGEDA
jgi:hypothetical protein